VIPEQNKNANLHKDNHDRSKTLGEPQRYFLLDSSCGYAGFRGNKKSAFKGFWLGVIIVTLFSAAMVEGQTTSEESQSQEIYLSFSYAGITNTVITALYEGDSVYIPIGTLFKQLHVDESINLRDSTIKGFFINPNRQYEINFARHIARLGKREISFDSSKVIIGQIDFYVLPSLLSKIFNLNFSADFSSLGLSLTTEEELPIVTEYQREARRSYLVSSPQASLLQAPLAYPRNRSLLNGGVVDYSLSGFNGAGQSAYNYNLTGGAELLGGETEGTIFGNISGGSSSVYSSDLVWKYVFDSTNYISYAGLGNLSSNGLTQYSFRGIQISNEPATLRTIFSKYVIDAKTKPNWDVELYLNGQLVGYSQADAEGNAHFTIPLVYGTSFIQLKYYGPSGEVIESDRRLQIPFTFVPTGQITYTIGGGKLNNTDYDFLSGDAVAGITDWLTDKIGMDYVDDPMFSKPLFYNSLSLRISSEYTVNLDAAPSAYYRSTFNALYPSQSSFDLEYSRYQTNLLYNPSDKIQDAQADISIPLVLSSSSFSVRGSTVWQEYVGGQTSYSYSAFFNASVGQFNTSLGYLASILDYGYGSIIRSYGLTADVLYSFSLPEGAFDFLNGSLLNTTMRYGVLKNSLDDIRFELSKNIGQYVRVAVAAERDFVNRFSIFSLQIVADLPFTRLTGNSQTQNGRTWLTENLSGSIGLDSKYDDFVFNNLGWVGHSAASIRMFVDNNNDGVYDEGDEIISGGSVTLRQAVASEVSSEGVVREWNLLPYTQYSADIDLSSIKNPLLIPKMKSFSFVTDPNSYKPIDIPFFAGGIVDGTVLKVGEKTTTAIPGLSIEIKSLGSDLHKTISVFNDGSFYYMGLPPGKYEAYVDSSQLSMLGVYADPAVLTFEVKATKNGDFVEGLTILLRDKNPKDTTTTGSLIETPWKIEVASQLETGKSDAHDAVHVDNDAFGVRTGAPTAERRDEKSPMNFPRTTKKEMRSLPSKNVNLRSDQTDPVGGDDDVTGKPDVPVGSIRYDASLMICESEKTLKYCYAIQLAEFHSSELASQFCETVFKLIGIRPEVKHDGTGQTFSVVLAPFKTEDDAVEAMSCLKEDSLFDNSFAFVLCETQTPKAITISLGNFSTNEAAINFCREIKSQIGVLPVVDFDKNKMTFRVSIRLDARTNDQLRFWISSIRARMNYPNRDLAAIP
jgi:hypothetical protein